MRVWPPWAAVVLGVSAFLAAMFALYALLTRKQRSQMRQIREGAAARGWSFRLRHWMGDPTAFRIDGRSRAGMTLVMRSGGTHGHNPGWTVVLGIRFLEAAGDPDVAIFPRKYGDGDAMAPGVSAELEERVAAFSRLAAGAIELLRTGEAEPSGAGEFDAKYRVIALPGHFQRPLVSEELATRILRWPEETVAAHSVVAWRDPFGFHVQARLPAPANWATICYALEIAEDLCARLPAGKISGGPRGLVDRVVAWIAER